MESRGNTSPIRKEAYENLQINAGIFLPNFNYSSITSLTDLKTALAAAKADPTKILGVTRNGGSFTVTKSIRQPEVDGLRYNFVGGDIVDSVEASLSGTELEVTGDNFKRLLTTGDVTTAGNVTTVKMRTAIDESDYLTNLCWAGDKMDGKIVLIVLKNAINTADFTLSFTDRNEGTMAFEFHARQADVEDYEYAPFEIKEFDD